jgi:ComF family protein
MIKINKTKIENIFYDCLYPIFCLNCGKFISNENKHYLCVDCFKTIPIYSALFCPVCFKRISIIKKCHHNNKSYLDFLGCATDYENEPVKNLIHEFKYNFVKEIKITLGDFLINYWLKISSDLEINPKEIYVIPIPLSSKRYNWRGFNQSEELAKIFADYFNFPLLTNVLIRQKNTLPQAQLTKKERLFNLIDAFKIKNDSKSLIKNKTIILVDDVYTSGATLQQAAKVLKQNDAKKIIGLVVAK